MSRKKPLNDDDESFIQKMKGKCKTCNGSGEAICTHKAGKLLREMRLNLGITVVRMAEELGMLEMSLIHREKGKTPVNLEFIKEYIRATKRVCAESNK